MPTSGDDRADCPPGTYGSQAPKLLGPNAARLSPRRLDISTDSQKTYREGWKFCGERPPEPNPNEDARQKSGLQLPICRVTGEVNSNKRQARYQDLSLASRDKKIPTRAARPQFNRIAGKGEKNSVPGRNSNLKRLTTS